jgi:hypothetical protein
MPRWFLYAVAPAIFIAGFFVMRHTGLSVPGRWTRPVAVVGGLALCYILFRRAQDWKPPLIFGLGFALVFIPPRIYNDVIRSPRVGTYVLMGTGLIAPVLMLVGIAWSYHRWWPSRNGG